jgi:hypothetical protein
MINAATVLLAIIGDNSLKIFTGVTGNRYGWFT